MINIYLFADDGPIGRLSVPLYRAIIAGDVAVEGLEVKILDVLEVEFHKEPIMITSGRGYRFSLGLSGRVDLSKFVEPLGSILRERRSEDNVISLKPRIQRRLWRAATRWTPSEVQLAKVCADLRDRRLPLLRLSNKTNVLHLAQRKEDAE